MSVELKMPALSPTMEEGTLARWLVEEGDNVLAGDILAEVETDKATMELEAEEAGVIRHLVVDAGTDGVKVGSVIAIMTSHGGDVVSTVAPLASVLSRKTAGAIEQSPAMASAKPVAAQSSVPASSATSPLATLLAQRWAIDLAAVTPANGAVVILKTDLDRVRGKRSDPRPVAKPILLSETIDASTAAKPVSRTPYEHVELSPRCRATAKQLAHTIQTVPHIHLTVEVQITALLDLRVALNESLRDRNIRLSVNDMLIKALALAMNEVPSVNVGFVDDELLQYNRADISVTVATADGVVSPIVEGANNKSLSAISVEMVRLAARARNGELAAQEWEGGTAALANLGLLGVRQYDALVTPPQAMVVAIGTAEPSIEATDSPNSDRRSLLATGGFDRRAIEVRDAAQMMSAFKRLCEAPLNLTT